MVLKKSSEGLGSRSEIFRILVFAMTTAGENLLLVFRCFANNMVHFGVVFSSL